MAEPVRHGAVERALLGYVLTVELLLTLSPFRFAWRTDWDISWWGDLHDARANVLLFLPVEYIFRLALSRKHPHPVRAAFLFGAALGASIETLQLFLPDRLTSIFDVLSNAAGAGAG